MDARVFSCPECGYVGPADDLTPGFALCPECGGRGRPEVSPPPFDRSTYRYGTRLLGLMSQLAGKIGAGVVRDGADRPIARVVPARMKPRRFLALSAGSIVFAATLLAYAWLVGELPENWLLARLVMLPGVLLVLGLSLSIVCLLSPGPQLALVAAGSDPRLLLCVRPERESWTSSALAVEDGEGRAIGTVVLHRLRNAIIPLGALGPIALIEPAQGPRVVARRESTFLPGVVFTREDDGDPVATFACNAALFARDALQIIEDPPLDRRLLIVAMVLVRP